MLAPGTASSLLTVACLTLWTHLVTAACPHGCLCTSDQMSCERAGLTDVPSSIPPGVIAVDMPGNKVHVLHAESLSHLFSVVRLKISDSELEIIADGAFRGTPRLQALDLSGNRLANLSRSTFDGVRATLLHLDLSNNKLVSIDSVFHGMNELSRLDIRNNLLLSVRRSALQDLHNLRHLMLSENQIQHVEDSAFDDLHRLMYFVAKGNPFGRNMGRMPNSTSISYVDLSECSLPRVPSGLSSAVRYLQLRRNNITSISKESLKGCSQLGILVLDENRISEIEDESFSDLTNLQQLWLNHNRLQMIPRPLPANLRRLLLESNDIRDIDNETFASHLQLEHLALAGNSISSIQRGALNGLINLQSIDLSNNKLHVLSSNTFQNNSKLKILLLARNPLHYFQADCFDGLRSLSKLSLAYVPNKEIKLGERIFEELESITQLDLDSSPTVVRGILKSDELLLDLASLRELSMRNAYLRTMRSDFEAFFPNLVVFHISSGRWHCDSRILWLRNWLLAESSRIKGVAVDDDNNVCLTPVRLRNRLIVSLATSELDAAGIDDVFLDSDMTSSDDVSEPVTERIWPREKHERHGNHFPVPDDTNHESSLDAMSHSKSEQLSKALTNNLGMNSSKEVDWDDIYISALEAAAANKRDDSKNANSFPLLLEDYNSDVNDAYNDRPAATDRAMTSWQHSSSPSMHRVPQPQSRRHEFIIFSVAMTIVATIIIIVVIVALIVKLSSSSSGNNRLQQTSQKEEKPKSESSSSLSLSPRKRVLAEVSKSPGQYFLVSTSCIDPSALPTGKEPSNGGSTVSGHSTPDTSKKIMSLVPGRDVNHEGPLRVYKWTDF